MSFLKIIGIFTKIALISYVRIFDIIENMRKNR